MRFTNDQKRLLAKLSVAELILMRRIDPKFELPAALERDGQIERVHRRRAGWLTKVRSVRKPGETPKQRRERKWQSSQQTPT